MTSTGNDTTYEVEEIVDRRKRGNRIEYRVRWKNYSAADDTWEPVENLGEETLAYARSLKFGKLKSKLPNKEKDTEVAMPKSQDRHSEGSDNQLLLPKQRDSEDSSFRSNSYSSAEESKDSFTVDQASELKGLRRSSRARTQRNAKKGNNVDSESDSGGERLPNRIRRTRGLRRSSRPRNEYKKTKEETYDRTSSENENESNKRPRRSCNRARTNNRHGDTALTQDQPDSSNSDYNKNNEGINGKCQDKSNDFPPLVARGEDRIEDESDSSENTQLELKRKIARKKRRPAAKEKNSEGEEVRFHKEENETEDADEKCSDEDLRCSTLPNNGSQTQHYTQSISQKNSLALSLECAGVSGQNTKESIKESIARKLAALHHNMPSKSDEQSNADLCAQNEEISTSLQNLRSPRASASKANKRLSNLFEDQDNVDDIKQKLSSKIGLGVGEDDEDYSINEESDHSSESSGIYLNGDDVSIDVERRGSQNGDDISESFLDSDGSSENEESGRNYARTEIGLILKGSIGRRDEWQRDETHLDNTNGATSKSFVLTSSHMPHCNSSTDAITMDSLPSKHVCFFMPDGKTKQCFSLETLHKIALSGKPFYSQNKITFKQPPHFRAAMSDDLIDQIASRFGRVALDLNGYFYNRTINSFEIDSSDEETVPDYMVNFTTNISDDNIFFDSLQNYMTRNMGSRDISCCPICYVEANRVFQNQKSDAEEENTSIEADSGIVCHFTTDPMAVLNHVDEIASAFCFQKISEVKEHLRQDHELDLSSIKGNDLYKCYQIRATDGLVQRYLSKRWKIAFQGAMAYYWGREGNSELFVYLQALIERRILLREKLATSDAEDNVLEEAREFHDKIHGFWSSFASRTQNIWERVAAPYQQASQEELDEFIANDDEEEVDSGDPINYHLINQGQDVRPPPDEEVIASLRKKQGKETNENYSSEETSSDDDAIEYDSATSSYRSNEQCNSSEAESEDEWLAAIKRKHKVKVRKGRHVETTVLASKTEAIGREQIEKKNANVSDKVEIALDNDAERSSIKKRRVIQDSDDD